MKKTIVLIAAALACVEWTRLAGTVKVVNLKNNTVTLQNKDGDLIMVPVDYQVKIVEKRGELRDLKGLVLNEKITLLRVAAEAPPPEDMSGMASPEKR